MAIGERLRFLRSLRGMTQKYLGMKIGFTENTADVRMTQYESGARTPKEKMIKDFATVLEVSPLALTIPDIDSYLGLAHTLFALEDLYGLKTSETNGEVCLRLDKSKGRNAEEMLKFFTAWRQEAAKLESGEITEDEYNKWRYRYPEFDTTQKWTKVPSQELSDYLVEQIKE
ncbi:MAG: helix-turn-helix domain-containing protein [Oscillospiraceae bacterium]|jgi:transcriptional regulator with XRE-family HTH domain|nr:helix-turn-helix domain-containing protein [Oscillospiraceae bacterium]